MHTKIVALCTAVMAFSGCSRSDPQPQARTFPVTIGDVVQRDAPVYIEAIGNVQSLQVIQIRPQIGGVIREAHVGQGAYVKKGDLLYTIDQRPYQAALDLAKATLQKDEAALTLAKITVKHYEGLVQKDYVPKLNFEQYTSNVEIESAQILIDQALIDQAQINLDYCSIHSPIDGKISQYNIDPGNLVMAYDANALTTIRQITPADIHFNITQRDFVAVQKSLNAGMLKFEVILPQDQLSPRQGQIYFIDNNINLNTGTILFKGLLENEDEFFWPGEFVRVRLQLKVIADAILVADEAVQTGQAGSFVYIYQPETSTVEYRPVVKGTKVDRFVIIEKGIKTGEKVVLQGQVNLRPGAKVYLQQDTAAIMPPSASPSASVMGIP